MKTIFETERLRARKFEPEDARRLWEIHSEEEAAKWIPNERYADPREALEAIRFFAGRADRKELPFVLAVERKETGELIGDAGINEVEEKPGEVEVGFVICRECRGKGYATEALRAMTELAAAAFGTEVLYGRVMRGNGASARVLEKNGYSFVSEEYGAQDDPYGRGMLVYAKRTGTQQTP